MTPVFMQPEFLPTNISNPPSDTLALVAVGLMLLAIVLLLPANILKAKRMRVSFGTLATVLFLSGCILGVNQMAVAKEASLNDKAENRKNLVTNVESVYDIEGIDLPNRLWNHDGSALNVIVYQDGLAYSAKLFEDPKTFEPTLSVMVSPDAEAKPIRKK